MSIDERNFENNDAYGWYYLGGDPEQCDDHVIVIIAQDSEGPFIYGCRSCGLRYIEIDAFL